MRIIQGKGDTVSSIQAKTYVRPESLGEAIEILNREGAHARPVAGGMDLVQNPPSTPTTLVDLSALGLSAITTRDGGVTLGATATLTEAIEHPAVTAYLDGVVLDMLRQVASPLHRNLSTIGGAVASARPWSDVITLFLALGATVTRFDGKSRRVSLDDLYRSREALRGAILTQVDLPEPGAGTRAGFWKYSRTGFDIALLNSACLVRVQEGRCTMARVVIGATPRLASRVPACEERLAGRMFDAEAIEAAARAAQAAETVGDDRRASAAYRRELVYVGVKRCLGRLLDRGEGE
jgi:aerobic carbon-monoxide dehydrogenase medium subunit